ncbi:3-dehydroquinate synthase [Altererythrobacter sp.]|nr:3-dehydroquinate synthase [Altererythrobacter sp.]
MALISVELAGRSYDVHVDGDLLESAGEIAAPFLRKRTVPIVADRTAWELHGQRLAASFTDAGHDSTVYLVEAGESSKSWTGLQSLTDWLLQQGVERGDHVVALGGGVVGDLTGFACSIVKRGCGFIQIPTTLLAQVDSSVGGKTAINTGVGKNLVGAFHQPALVLADISTLTTLPQRQMQAGFAEVIKYGILGDADFFNWCSEHAAAILSHDTAKVKEAVSRSVQAKADIVAEDERETTGQRALLNLGHTFGHALEAEVGFSDRLLHGEGVAIGMVLAARYSARRGHLSIDDAEAVARAIAKAGMPSEVAALGLQAAGSALVDHMLHDKKMDAGTLPFLLLRSIGAAFVAKDVDLTDVAAFLDEQLIAH